MTFYKKLLFLICFVLIVSCKNETKKSILKNKKISQKVNHQLHSVQKANEVMLIDGLTNESVWKNAKWLPINQVWLGNPVESNDFNGHYKLTWSEEALYVLVEIKDDILRDKFQNPLERWWDEDCVEIFIDEDNSGGNHQFNHNAFAYHIDTKGNVVDIIAENTPKLFNDHVQSKMVISGENTYRWEFKISLFSDDFEYGKPNQKVELSVNKKIGFAIAYCDNDNSEHRENFIGSVVVEGNDKDRGWIDANIFGTIELED